MNMRAVLTSLLLASGLTLTSCAMPEDSVKDEPSTPAAKGTALAALQKLPVKGRASKTGYDRDQFGSEWDDSVGSFSWSRNGCDTRNDVLARDLINVEFTDGRCDVARGVLPYDPYSGETAYTFDSEDDLYETDLDIEHVVALGNAWETGAQQLSPDRRAEFANDPLNLMAVNPSLNRQKSDGDFATWLPPNNAFRCSYAARQIRVKTVYDLWVTAPEKAAMEKVLATCPSMPLDQPLPPNYNSTIEASPTVPSKPSPTQSPTPTTKPTATSSPKSNTGGKTDRRFPSCTALHDAGFEGNYVKGQDPEYGWYDDRDGDGRACES